MPNWVDDGMGASKAAASPSGTAGAADDDGPRPADVQQAVEEGNDEVTAEEKERAQLKETVALLLNGEDVAGDLKDNDLERSRWRSRRRLRRGGGEGSACRKAQEGKRDEQEGKARACQAGCCAAQTHPSQTCCSPGQALIGGIQ